MTLFLFHIDLNIYAFVGLIMLIGIVEKNAIMQIDFALEAERQRNLSPRDAIYEGCLIRFRPIMMTTMSAMLGAVPIALGYGAGGEARQPLGLVVVGGLLFSQLVTLYLTPVFYTYMAALQDPRARLEARQEASDRIARGGVRHALACPGQIALAILLSGLAVSMTDWLSLASCSTTSISPIPKSGGRPLAAKAKRCSGRYCSASSPAERSWSPARPFTYADTPPPRDSPRPFGPWFPCASHRQRAVHQAASAHGGGARARLAGEAPGGGGRGWRAGVLTGSAADLGKSRMRVNPVPGCPQHAIPPPDDVPHRGLGWVNVALPKLHVRDGLILLPADVDGQADAYVVGGLTLQITEVMSSAGGPPPVKASTVSWMPRTTSAALLCRWDIMNSRTLSAPNCASSLLAASVTPSVNKTSAPP